MNTILVSFLIIAASAVVAQYPVYPQYKFEYAVHDPHTQDIKKQWESRDGDRVHGSYSLVEPDGSHRVVDYQADGHNGFSAIVHRRGHAYHPQTTYHGNTGYYGK